MFIQYAERMAYHIPSDNITVHHTVPQLYKDGYYRRLQCIKTLIIMPIGAKTTGIVQCLCYAVGGILLECFGWKGYCKVLLSDHFFPLMNYFYTDGSVLAKRMCIV